MTAHSSFGESSQAAHAMTAVLVQHWLSDLRPVIPARD
jgi:hypothetical protein